MTEKVNLDCAERAKNRDHPEVLRAEEFLKKLQLLCREYQVEFDEVKGFFLVMKPSKWGTNQIGLFCIEEGKWVFSAPWGG